MKRLPVIILLFAILASCNKDDPQKPVPAEEPRATRIEEAMAYVLSALNTQNLALYDSLLAPDFRFVFLPEDTLAYPQMPASLGIARSLPPWTASSTIRTCSRFRSRGV